MYETEDSSVASSSYADQDEMEHFMNRCSICFDAQLDFCLEYCKDQYCLECFQKYIIEVVKSSWGLSVTPIRCPVCTELIPKHEWSQYVPRKIIEIYDKFNKPYRSYTRACPHCETDMIPCTYNCNNSSSYPFRLFCDIMEDMLHSCSDGEVHKNHTEHIAVKRWIPIYKRQDWSDSNLTTLYKRMMKDILTFEKNHILNNQQYNFAYNISLQFTSVCSRPEVWKQIQFAHISFFPQMNCPECKSNVCLQCGHDAHDNLVCEDNMKKMLTNKSLPKDTRDVNIPSRRCPNCSIMINRDEGCNKVDCSYCGFSFCWACRSSWAEGCGFYRCPNVSGEFEVNSNATHTNNNVTVNEEKTEIGVPNMKSIQARLVNYRPTPSNNTPEMDID
ncbi:hypothetical protein CU098_005068 [Rhizopus stolonifer]|uniref:RBR-type E3 ubiquitin transferase n=1 Tax=Rhizopus stolonifer TaxID=4846 RepID=A0A367KT74_RHIST|nr:hypothetical protein CU098_005068 [Rhizopus stolonifer]